jgi:hypothetical protein
MKKASRYFAEIFSLACCLGLVSVYRAAAQETTPEQSGEVVEGRPAESPRAAQTRGLNNKLLLLHLQMQTASPSEMYFIRDQAAPVIAQRAAALTALIKENPRAALTFAFSPELLDDLAKKFPQAAAILERHGTWSGPVEVWVVDHRAPAHSETTVQMKVGAEWLDVHFAGRAPANLISGASLRATGVRVGSAIVASDSTVQASTTTLAGRDEQ